MCPAVEVHDQQLSAPRPLGARGRARCPAAAAGRRPVGHATASQHCVAPLRHAQSMDGRHALPVSTITSGECRDEPARSGLQPEAGHEDHGNRAADPGASHLIAQLAVAGPLASRPTIDSSAESGSSFHTASAVLDLHGFPQCGTLLSCKVSVDGAIAATLLYESNCSAGIGR